VHNRKLASRARTGVIGVAAAALIVGSIVANPTQGAAATLPPATSSEVSRAIDSDPQIWSLMPGGRSVTSIGTMMLIDFTEPMRPNAVRVDIEPATKFWWHWSGSQQLVIQPQFNWRPTTSYRVTVTGISEGGRGLVGQREFWFTTDRAPAFGESCAMRVLVYHINGKPKPGELGVNFVDWRTFELQLDQLQTAGYRFGAPDQVCARGNEKMVSLQFDDGWATQYPAAQILAKRGIVAFFAITLGNLDKPGYMTRTQVRLLPRMGMLVGSHLMSHDCITTSAGRLTPAARQQYFDLQLRTSQLQLEQLTGQPVHFLVYPYGCVDVETARQVQKYYWAAWTGLQTLPMPADLVGYARQRFTVTEEVRFR
jgi:peptidoglycan/xylan/chitin deacetylase (PgdA/CDA1 family)